MHIVKATRRAFFTGLAGWLAFATSSKAAISETIRLAEPLGSSIEKAAVRQARALLGAACVNADPALTQEYVRAELLERLNNHSLAERITFDFQNGNMKSIDGWYLSQTEILLFSYAYHEVGHVITN